jgi:predicted nucleotidyltransferase
MTATGEAVPPIDIQPEHWRIVQDILRHHAPQYEVWAFGSRAQKKAKPYSDLDLVVVAEAPLPLFLTGELSEAFSESDLPWKVDVLDWASVDPPFQQIIKQNRVVIQIPSA